MNWHAFLELVINFKWHHCAGLTERGLAAEMVMMVVSSDDDVMMTSSNGNIFRVTGPLCGEFTGPGELPTQRSVTRSFDVFLDLRLNNRLSKQWWGWWFETPSWSLWRQCNGDDSGGSGGGGGDGSDDDDDDDEYGDRDEDGDGGDDDEADDWWR